MELEDNEKKINIMLFWYSKMMMIVNIGKIG